MEQPHGRLSIENGSSRVAFIEKMKHPDRERAKNHIGEPYPIVWGGGLQGGKIMSQRG